MERRPEKRSRKMADGLATVTLEEARKLREKPPKSFREKLIMAINKSSEGSIKIAVSPATVALMIGLILHTVAVVWWAQGVSKDIETDKAKIQSLEGELGKQQVYINDTREKFIKMQTQFEAMQQKLQLEQMIKEKER